MCGGRCHTFSRHQVQYAEEGGMARIHGGGPRVRVGQDRASFEASAKMNLREHVGLMFAKRRNICRWR